MVYVNSPVKILGQCIELFGNPRGSFTSRGVLFCFRPDDWSNLAETSANKRETGPLRSKTHIFL